MSLNYCIQDYYSSHDIKYLGLRMFDVPQTNIAKFFEEAADYIEDALKNEGKFQQT